ncbi:choline kinase [Candidatus Mycoplasma haematohominis]|uniref:choline kinase n=1 Tax=Candidatus Mycoplasma haematohominis TaxID=1494318 RepID=UPI001C0A6D69|nr:choline kinase [Candidatus Mycoplasma haemohominis]
MIIDAIYTVQKQKLLVNKSRFLFNKVVPEENISSIERIFQGYSNYVFKVFTDKGNYYKVRIGNHNELIDRVNEQNIFKNLNLEAIYYEIETGNGVWHWIDGRSLRFEEVNEEIIGKLVSLIEDIHSKGTVGVLQHDDLEFLNEDKLDFQNVVLYRRLVNKYKKEIRVLSHNDVSLSNLIYEPKTGELTLIDYEWGRVNHPYWDYGNFVKESNLSKELMILLAQEANLSLYKLYEFAIIATLYSFQLSFVFKEQTIGLQEYRNRLSNQLLRYKECLWSK